LTGLFGPGGNRSLSGDAQASTNPDSNTMKADTSPVLIGG